jgi:hypothetical protein
MFRGFIDELDVLVQIDLITPKLANVVFPDA